MSFYRAVSGSMTIQFKSAAPPVGDDQTHSPHYEDILITLIIPETKIKISF